ncbi:hypothetical protein KUTeg_008065 [Tegillarca granosa]|uniref:Uncharacterized protein n=1 Tax=Tegillarca granosa TaxID=220873 RepID=A0ABQ9F818_TEGGR|nr:hypothetical protein KUTeg_008065 [Tegillarca granosa]
MWLVVGLHVEWIPRESNVKADIPSKIGDCNGLKLDKHVSQNVLDSGADRSSSLCPRMCKLLLASKSDNTYKSYFNAFKRWELCISKHEFCSLPALPIHVALYLTHLLHQGSTTNVINTVVYGIKWAHELNGLSGPTKNSYVTSLVEAGKRIT